MQFKFHNQFVYRTPINAIENKSLSDEMIYLASPILLEEYKKNNSDEKVLLSIKKYGQRASSRCTPFGLFAGCGVGDWHAEKIKIIADTRIDRQTRLDMNVTCEIAQFLSQQSVIKKELTYYPNNSSYKIADKIRYVEYTLLNKMRSYQITAIEQSEYLNEIIEAAKDGISYANILEVLLKYDVNQEEAESFIDELIQAQVLLSNIYPNVTGEEFYKNIIHCLKKIHQKNSDAGIAHYIHLLESIAFDIQTIDANKNNPIERYKSVLRKVQEILPTVTEENLFQTDLYLKYASAHLANSYQNKIIEVITFLNHLFPKQSQTGLSKFKENFSKRYESQEKALLEVLDTECGIGFKSKDNTGINLLVDDIFATGKGSSEYELKWNPTFSLLFKKLITALQKNSKEVHFTDLDLKTLEKVEGTFPPSMAVFFSILNQEQACMYFKHASGSSASNLLGRFAHGHSGIHSLIKATTAHEKDFYKDKIIAEILHLPESRIGNVLLRPHIHDYEIAYLANSTKPKDFVIDLNDLYVSVAGDRIILKSKKLNKEIIPRLTTAHNYSMSSLPVYQFLCEIQNQYYNSPSVGFNWGPLANEFDFLPRAVYKDVILSPASWHIKKDKFEKLLDNLKQYQGEAVEIWRNSLNLPTQFLLSDGDNELLVDITDSLSVKAFLSAIKKRENITLTEFLQNEKNDFVVDEAHKTYTNELIALIYNQDFPNSNEVIKNEIEKTVVKRNFITGSEWLYYKIYCSTKSAETILVSTLLPFIETLMSEQMIEHWFFIRYADPETHLRIRFKVNGSEQLAAISKSLNALLNPMLENSLVEKVVNDTYAREIERYGSWSMDLSEQLFAADSNHILKLINALNDDEQGDVIKMKYACYYYILLLEYFGFDNNDLLKTIDRGQLSYFNEHGGNKDLKLQLDNKYRKYRKEIESFLIDPSAKASEENTFVYDLSQTHFKTIQPIISQVKSILLLHKEVAIEDYIFSLVHMHVNRVFKSKQRTYELVMYDFLQRSLKSINARKSKNKV